MTEKQSNPYQAPRANIISKLKSRLSWSERRTYKKIVDADAVSEDMAAFERLYREIYSFGDTLHIHVNAESQGVVVPSEYVQEGVIVLDISPRAISKFEWTSSGLKFAARFSGKAKTLEVPLRSLLAIYNLETELGVELTAGG